MARGVKQGSIRRLARGELFRTPKEEAIRENHHYAAGISDQELENIRNGVLTENYFYILDRLTKGYTKETILDLYRTTAVSRARVMEVYSIVLKNYLEETDPLKVATETLFWGMLYARTQALNEENNNRVSWANTAIHAATEILKLGVVLPKLVGVESGSILGPKFLNLYGHQADFAYKFHKYLNSPEYASREIEQDFAILAPRQTGKTALLVDILSKFCRQHAGKVSGYVVPTYSLFKKVIVPEFLNLGLEGMRINKVDGVITFPNGAVIHFISAQLREFARGAHIDGILVVDEAAQINKEWFDGIVGSFTKVSKPPVIYVSTPLFREGLFYDKFMNPRTITTDFSKFDLSPVQTAEYLEQKKKEVAPNIFKAEYLGQWIDANGSVFRRVDAICSLPCYEDRYGCLLQADYKHEEEIYFGLDWAAGEEQDYTVLSGFTIREGKIVQVFLWEDNQLSPKEVCEFINRICSAYNVGKILAEVSGIGRIYFDFLSDPSILVPFEATNANNRLITDTLSAAFENDAIQLLDYHRQKIQLLNFTAKRTPAGKLKYEGAKDDIHDDIVDANCMGYLLVKQQYKL
jgi:hypothetical protein